VHFIVKLTAFARRPYTVCSKPYMAEAIPLNNHCHNPHSPRYIERSSGCVIWCELLWIKLRKVHVRFPYAWYFPKKLNVIEEIQEIHGKTCERWICSRNYTDV